MLTRIIPCTRSVKGSARVEDGLHLFDRLPTRLLETHKNKDGHHDVKAGIEEECAPAPRLDHVWCDEGVDKVPQPLRRDASCYANLADA